MMTAGGLIFAFIIMALVVDMRRLSRDLMPWTALMFGVAFLCATNAYEDIKSERAPRQKKVTQVLLLIITIIFFAVAIASL